MTLAKKDGSGMIGETLTPASLPVRLAAMFYDAFLLFAVECAVTAAVVGIRIALEGSAPIVQSGRAAVGGLTLQIPLLITWVMFFGWFWTRNGQTLGMQTWRLRIVTADGKPPGWRTVLLRLAGACVSAACLGAGYAWMLFDADKLTWHDRWSGTRVVRAWAK
jgi:uncharacterized RDD family membrane protein YckC